MGVSSKLAGEYMALYERYKDRSDVSEELGHLVRFNQVPLFEEQDAREKGGGR